MSWRDGAEILCGRGGSNDDLFCKWVLYFLIATPFVIE